MAIKINAQEYLTFEEQVLKNKQDIERLLASKNIVKAITVVNKIEGGHTIWSKLSRFLSVAYKVDKGSFTITAVYNATNVIKDYNLTLRGDGDSEIFEIKTSDKVTIMYNDYDGVTVENTSVTLKINDKVYNYKGIYELSIAIPQERVKFVKVEDVCLW